MERCIKCGRQADVIMFDTGLRVPYCADHHPDEPSREDQNYLDIKEALDVFRG